MNNCVKSPHDIRKIDTLVEMGKRTKVEVFKERSTRAVVVVEGVRTNVLMERVAFVPDFMTNLLFVSRFRKKKLSTKFTETSDNCGNGMVGITNTKTINLIVKRTKRSYGLCEIYICPYTDHESAEDLVMVAKSIN